jgi:hypothetical protein
LRLKPRKTGNIFKFFFIFIFTGIFFGFRDKPGMTGVRRAMKSAPFEALSYVRMSRLLRLRFPRATVIASSRRYPRCASF